jgi:hypothetical protein
MNDRNGSSWARAGAMLTFNATNLNSFGKPAQSTSVPLWETCGGKVIQDVRIRAVVVAL